MLHSLHEHMIDAFEGLVAEQNLMNSQLFDNWFTFVQNIRPEVESLFYQGISLVCSLEVLSYLADRNV